MSTDRLTDVPLVSGIVVYWVVCGAAAPVAAAGQPTRAALQPSCYGSPSKRVWYIEQNI